MMLPRCCIVQSFLSLPVSFSSFFPLKTLDSFNLEYIYRNVIVNIPLRGSRRKQLPRRYHLAGQSIFASLKICFQCGL